MTIYVPAKDWNDLVKSVRLNNWINEKDAAELLGVSKKSMYNYAYSGRIPPEAISIGVGGNKFYNREYLIGLKKAPGKQTEEEPEDDLKKKPAQE